MNKELSLADFKKKYDKKNSVVLLEGKRNVAKEDAGKLSELGRLLALNTRHILFRSGNADGADYLFSQGVAGIDSSRLQVITPYRGHRRKYILSDNVISLDDIDLSSEPEIIRQTCINKRYESLVGLYLSGKKDQSTVKAPYLLRDTLKVMGTKEMHKASFAVFYDDLEGEMSGGTGHTMFMCRQNKVPFINQKIWFDWLK